MGLARTELTAEDGVDVVAALQQGERLVISRNGVEIGAVVTMGDLERLRRLDEAAAERVDAVRRGELWEQWEGELMLDESLDEEAIARQTERTPKSVHERRRWIRRIAEARGKP